MIKTVSTAQGEILNWIITLYCPGGFELDPTYSRGLFYNNVPQPKYKFDLVPQTPDTRQADCRNLPIDDGTITSVIFDPPFIGASRKHGKAGIIKSRFGYYKNVPVLWKFYEESLREFRRILKPNGVLVFKCQDTVESGKQWLSHVKIINTAEELGFYCEDLFILLASTRLMSPNMWKQKHARKYHSYFLVFRLASQGIKPI